MTKDEPNKITLFIKEFRDSKISFESARSKHNLNNLEVLSIFGHVSPTEVTKHFLTEYIKYLSGTDYKFDTAGLPILIANTELTRRSTVVPLKVSENL